MLTLARNMKRLAVCLMTAAAVLSAGCPADLNPADVAASTSTAPRLIEVKAGSKVNATTHMLLVHFKAVQIELPVGTASGSEEIWSYLDEEPLGAARGAALGRNGLRVGLGRQDSWPDLSKILRRMTGRGFKRSVKLTKPGTPVAFEMSRRKHDSTIFTSHADRSLSGADYPAGRYLLSVLCTLDEDEPSTILITATPQIQSARRKPKLAVLKGGVVLAAKPTIYNFPELTFQVSVPVKDFLVVGPGAQSRRPSSIGNHFFVRQSGGAQFETVIVLVPEVFAAPRRKKPLAIAPVPPTAPRRTQQPITTY